MKTLKWIPFIIVITASRLLVAAALTDKRSHGAPTVKVKLMLDKQRYFAGETIAARVDITTTGRPLQIPNTMTSAFMSLLRISNPDFHMAGGITITSMNGRVPIQVIHPGQTLTTNIYIRKSAKNRKTETFRIGFEVPGSSKTYWSNPKTIAVSQDQKLPVKIEAAVGGSPIKGVYVMPTKLPHQMIQVTIHNLAKSNISVGEHGFCCDPELQMQSSNPQIGIVCGLPDCPSSPCSPSDLILKPFQTYTQQCELIYNGKRATSEPISFEIGVKTLGHFPVWSDSLTVSVKGRLLK